ncbi:nucleotidyltransferase domain-containing protein [Halorubellus sp. PRR65]|uniref:nucleotidyltransferase domain-containing protein n=1 Tax=Halorubellus sp. PRR65 TaxID=3098148 RepID=UPI002B25F3D0|nr:nucleotidyltransferase domain-containing protein [Halorubellus sp. PRR65]
MHVDELELPYDEEAIRDYVTDAVAATGTRRQPRFYAVAGSHLFGFADADSDVDVRGVHVVPAAEYAYLREPDPDVTVNMHGTTEGFEAYADCDLRSNELKHFGSLLVDANFNVVELVLAAPAVMNGMPLEMDALRALVREHLPMNVPHSYLGMAKSNYYKYLDPDKSDGYDPSAKRFLHVYRGLLGAQYVLEREAVEPNVRALADAVDAADSGLVDELVAHKRDPDVEHVPDALAERARDAILAQFNALDPLPSVDKHGYRDAIDDWMRKVRG